MKLAVKLFARARDLAGSNQVELDVDPGATVGDLRRALIHKVPELAPLAAHLLIAVGSEYASDSVKLTAAMDIACFPPVSGG